MEEKQWNNPERREGFGEQDSHVLRTPVEQQLHLPGLLFPPGDDLEVSEHHGMSSYIRAHLKH